MYVFNVSTKILNFSTKVFNFSTKVLNFSTKNWIKNYPSYHETYLKNVTNKPYFITKKIL